MGIKETLGPALRSRRLAVGLSQKEVGEKVGVGQPTVSNWEQGKGAPDESQLQKLESFLGPVSATQTEEADKTSASVGESSPFGAWLNVTRTKNNWTVVELAKEAGLSQQTIYNLESGKIDNPQQRTRERLAKALKTEVPSEFVAATEQASEIQGLGQLIDFDPHDESALPEGPGVYVFYDVSQRPIYVGESGDLRSRIRDHNDKFWFKRPIVDTGSYITIKDQKTRKQIEKILIKFLKQNAVINKQYVARD